LVVAGVPEPTMRFVRRSVSMYDFNNQYFGLKTDLRTRGGMMNIKLKMMLPIKVVIKTGCCFKSGKKA
jgi:hypothetical protein